MTMHRTPYRGPRRVPRRSLVAEIERHLDTPGTTHLDTSGTTGDRPPILVVAGPSGIGKTTLLRQVNEQLSQVTPRALVDCSRYPASKLPELLTEVKFKLGRFCPGIGRIRFRRLEIGLAVSRERVDFSRSPAKIRRRLAELTRREIFPSPEAIRRFVGEVGEVGELKLTPKWMRFLIGEAAATATSRLLARPLLMHRYQNWYGHRDQGGHEDPLDKLTELNRQAINDHDRRDLRLTEAFLADLRDKFGRGRLARPGWYNCVLLLDNADSDAGHRLLQVIQELRRLLEISGTSAEPLLIVASGQRPIDGPDCEPYRLPPFTDAETAWLTDYVPADADRRFPKLLHRLTGGYPAAARLITEAACRYPEAATGSLDALMRKRLRDGDETVEDQLLADLATAPC